MLLHRVTFLGLCSNLVDTIGKECILGDKYLYSYKGIVDVPPLGMVDDLVCVSECGPEAVMMNSYVNAQTNLKKLQFGPEQAWEAISSGYSCILFYC